MSAAKKWMRTILKRCIYQPTRLAETFDIGMDTGTQVDKDYEGSPYEFTGIIDRVVITLTD